MKVINNPERCADESITATTSNTGHVQITKVVIPESVERAAAKLVSWFLPTLGTLVFILCMCSAIIALDISDRHAQEREFDRRARQSQREDDARAASLSEKLQDLQRQYRMAELKLDDWTVVAHRSGLVLPGDYARGPQGNPDSQSFKQSKRK